MAQFISIEHRKEDEFPVPTKYYGKKRSADQQLEDSLDKGIHSAQFLKQPFFDTPDASLPG